MSVKNCLKNLNLGDKITCRWNSRFNRGGHIFMAKIVGKATMRGHTDFIMGTYDEMANLNPFYYFDGSLPSGMKFAIASTEWFEFFKIKKCPKAV